MMPNLDGYETCKRIKSSNKTKDIPVIFISANVGPEDAVEGIESGGIDYITKPFNPKILLAKVKTHIKSLQKTKQLLELADKDSLTLLANRRCFSDFMDLEWRRCLRNKTPLSAIMIDIDHFKMYNDTYGHPQGDNTLKEVAAVLKDLCRRPGDLAARYGGEEFVVILSDVDYKNTTIFAGKLCEKVEQLSIPRSSSEVKDVVTVSVGAATVVPDEDTLPQQLIEMADVQLYKAKTSGRNQVQSQEVNS
ncbi:MAG: GGDEF domain-containing response regulator [Candidatus Anammoxibacter sp.]